MSSKKCTFNPEKARMAAENVRSYMKLRGEDFDKMVEESDTILKGLSDAELKSVVQEFDAFVHGIKHFPKGQLKEVANKVVFNGTKFRVPGRTVQLNPRRSIFVRGGTKHMPHMTEMPVMAGGDPELGPDEKKLVSEATDESAMAPDDFTGGSSQRGRSRSRSRSANTARSGSTQRNLSRSRSRSRHRIRSRHLGPQGRGLLPGAVRVAALLIPRSKTRFFQTLMWMGIITMAGYSGTTDGSFIQVGLKQIQSGNCEGGWGAFDWNRHPVCTAWKALKAPIVTGMNDMYRLDKQGFFTLLAGLAGMVMAPIVVNSGFYWLAYFMDYQITLMISAFLNIEFVAPEAQEPGLFTMLQLYRRVTNPFEALLWGRRLMGDNRHSRSRSRSRHRSHRSRSGHRSHRSSSRHSSTGNLVELARIRALQNMVRQERNRSRRSPSPVSLNSTRRRHSRNRNNQNRNSRRGNNNSNRNSIRNSRRNNRNRRSNRGSSRGSRR